MHDSWYHLEKIAEAAARMSTPPNWWEHPITTLLAGALVGGIIGFFARLFQTQIAESQQKTENTQQIAKLIGDEFSKRWKKAIYPNIKVNKTKDLNECRRLAKIRINENDFPICGIIYKNAYKAQTNFSSKLISSIIHCYVEAIDLSDRINIMKELIETLDAMPKNHKIKINNAEKKTISYIDDIDKIIKSINTESNNILRIVRLDYKYS